MTKYQGGIQMFNKEKILKITAVMMIIGTLSMSLAACGGSDVETLNKDEIVSTDQTADGEAPAADPSAVSVPADGTAAGSQTPPTRADAQTPPTGVDGKTPPAPPTGTDGKPAAPPAGGTAPSQPATDATDASGDTAE
jgi:hypothetical protein